MNPFDADTDRHRIWDMLVSRDIDAFVAGDWDQVAADFDAESFLAIGAADSADPDAWRLTPLEAYRASWLEQSARFTADVVDPVATLHEVTTLRDIEIVGDRALAHKKFDGWATHRDGTRHRQFWQTVYHCRRIGGRWRIVGFTGYLPGHGSAKRVPPSDQHVTAGPYSPVLDVAARRFVVISGQAALADDGTIIGDTIEDQTRHTLANCVRQLAAAGCTLADVFKVNTYLRDLTDWDRFNAVYREVVPEPRPVRTTVGVSLLGTMLVEIEMWAVRP